MIEEHAITIHGEINLDDLEYLAKKANRIGRNGRSLIGVKIERKDDKREVFFVVDEMVSKHNYCPY
ncbi:MAG: hypothetical protein ABFQ95_00985 [Pseudomonadota bacterium]